MTREQLLKKKIPDNPGVYFFLGPRKEILYIGKATSLRNRLKSYFVGDIREKRSDLIERMVADAKGVEWTITDSVLEAFILETNLIRTHKPRCNTLAKDDKSFNHLIITNEEFPRVLVVRAKDLGDYNPRDLRYIFGPFPSGSLFREALKIIRRIFQFYDTHVPVGEEKSKMARGKIDFNRQIGLYPGVQSRKEYLRTINHIKLFFEGKKNQLIRDLEKDMMRYAKEEQFEEANNAKRKIFALKHIEDIALIKADARVYRDEKTVRIEAYDIAHLGGKDMVGVMTVTEGGQPARGEYRKFKIQSLKGSNDTGALREVLERRLGHPEWRYPEIIAVDGSTAQRNAAEFVLKKAGVVVPVVAVVKDDRHRPIRVLGPKILVAKHHDAILLANAEAHRFAINFHRDRRSKQSFGSL